MNEKTVADNAPTANVGLVKHGRWEQFITSAYIGMDEEGEPIYSTRRFFVHKKCGRRTAVAESYCPQCGDKMDLDSEAGETRVSPETNGGRLRSMSNEELWNYLNCPFDTCVHPNAHCKECLVEWLGMKVVVNGSD
jgi:hypothetical protein